MELSREILKRFAQIANGNSNKKQTTPSYMNATAVVSDGVKYVQIDGSDQLTPVSETMGIQNGDRVLVTIENHQATVIGNYSYPADARTANEALSVGGQALTAAGQAIQRIDVLQASSITTENLQAGLASIGYLTATELRALNATVDTLDAKAITTDTLETESAKIGFVKAAQIEGTYATIEQLNAATARIGTLETDTLKSKDLESEVGKFGYLKADEAKLTYATIEQLNAKTVTADEILGVVIKAGYLTAYNADLKYATITSLNAATARIGTLETDTLKTKDLESEVGKFGYLKASNLESEVGEFGYLKADDAEVTYATIKQLDTESARIDVVTGDLASYKTVVAGQFTANDAVISELKAKDAELNTAIIGKASISELDAIKTRTGTLEANVADIDDLVNGNLTSDNIHSLVIAGDKFSIENGFIKNAMIENMSFDKITGFDINTTNFTVHSNDGKSTWTDNTIQISDSNRIRVQIGKDASGDYNIYIWDVNGNLMFDPLYGVQASGIKQAIIRNDMVSETAAIAGSKLDIESVVTEINGATTKLKSTTIYLDSEKQTLDVAFNTMETTITNNLNAAKEYANGVGTNTLSSAQQYAVEKANAALASANKHTDDELADIEEITTSHSTQIGVIQGQITSLISEDSSIKGDYNVLLSRYNSTVSDVDSIKSTIGEHTTLINSQNGEIEAVQTQVNTIESDLSGTKQTVSSMQTTVNSTESRVTTVETNLNGLTARVSETETDMSGLESRVSTAETTLTKDGLTTIIGTYYSTPENVDDAIENLDIGGRNLIPNSNFTNGKDGWVGYNDASLRVGNDAYYNKALIISHSNIIGSNPSKGMVYKAANDFVHESDTTYTLSFMAKTAGVINGAEPILFSAAVKLSSSDITKSKTHNITSSQWQKFTYTYTTGTIASDVVLAFWIANGPGPIHITNIKLEKGTKATDWTPAPEDTQSQIDNTNATIATHTETLSTHTSQIAANESAIALRVTTQDFNSYKTTVNGELTSAKSRLTTAESSITAMKGEIALKVEQTDIDTAVNGIEIGGRNLIYGTKDFSSWSVGSGWTKSVDTDGFSVYSFSASDRTAPTWSRIIPPNQIAYKDLLKGITVSFMLKIDDIEVLKEKPPGTPSYNVIIALQIYNAEGNRIGWIEPSYYKYSYDRELVSGEWIHTSYYFSYEALGCVYIAGDTVDDIAYVGFSWVLSLNGSIHIKKCKVEKGTKATDWTPAPEDIDASISDVDAKFANYSTTTQMTAAITAAKDSITQTVSETYSTKAELSTVSGNVSALTTRVSTAESKLTKDSLVTTIGSYYSTQTYVDEAVDGIEIGGRNLVLGTSTADVTNWYHYGWGGDWITYSEEDRTYRLHTSNGWRVAVYDMTDYVGENITISCDVLLQSISTNTEKILLVISERSDSTNTGSGTLSNFYTIGTTDTWYHYEGTITLSKPYLGFYIRGKDSDAGTGTAYVLFKNVKFEKGNRATDWTPAPEDVDSQITSVKTIATQTADKFNWIVASGTSATDFTLTDRTATLIAETISLNGDVKVNGDMLVDGCITATKISSGAITTDKLAAKSITTAKLATDAIKSTNYAYSSGNFSTAGTFLDLSTGLIRSKNFAIDANGNAYFSGELTAASGTFTGVLNGATGSFSGSVTTSNIIATGGTIGAINISTTGLVTEKQPGDGYGYITTIRNAESNDRTIEVVRHTVGGTDWAGMFYVRYDGYMYAANANISGAINATSIKAKDAYSIYLDGFSDEIIISANSWTDKFSTVSMGLVSKNSYISFEYRDDDEGLNNISAKCSCFSISGELQVTSNVLFVSGVEVMGDLTVDYNIHLGKSLIIGSPNQYIYVYNSGGALTSLLGLSSGNNLWIGDFGASGTECTAANAYIVAKNVYKRSSGSNTSLSDRRYKHDFCEIQNYREFIMGLHSQMFKFSDGTSDRYHAGFVAQDVEKIMLATTGDFGVFVKSEKDPDKVPLNLKDESTYICSIRYEELIPPHIALTQEHDHRLNDHDITFSKHTVKFVSVEAQLEVIQCKLDQAYDKIAKLEKQVEELRVTA